MIKEELGTWYPIVDEGEYWTDYDLNESYNVPKIKTVVTNGQVLWTSITHVHWGGAQWLNWVIGSICVLKSIKI